MLKRLITCLMLITIFSGLLVGLNRNVVGDPAGTMRILDSSAGSNGVVLGNESTQMPQGGYPFSVNVTIDGQFDSLFTFQVAVRFDKTKVNFTGGYIPIEDPDFVFFDKPIVTSGEPLVDNRFSQYAFVVLGATLFLETINVSKGLLCTLSFVAQRVGSSMIDFSIEGVISTDLDTTFLLKLIPDREEPVDIAFATESFSVSTFAAPSPPVPLFEFAPAFPDVNVNVTFDSSKSYDPVGSITSYNWDFDDGTTFTSTNTTPVLHVFSASQVYHVNLTAYNNFSLSSSTIQEVQVGHVPSVNFTYSPNEVMPDDTVTFDASLSGDIDGTMACYVWNFDDNSSLVNSTEASVAHIYTKKGVYDVQLTAYDNNGLHNSTSTEVFIGRRPTVLATYAPERPFAFDVVSFNASATHAGEAVDDIVTLRWDFGDYNITEVDVADSGPVNPFITTHVYYSGQPYSGNLTAFDNNGLYSTYAFQVDVQKLPERGSPNYALYLGIAGGAIVILALAVVLLKRRKK